MSVKKKDRHVAQKQCLASSRKLISQILILVRAREFDNMGKQTRKPGILGEGQAFQLFGLDLFRCAKSIHANCYQAAEIRLSKEPETLIQRNAYHKQAIEYCNSIFRLLDLCIFQYAQESKKKLNSFEYVAKLTKEVKRDIQDRMNRDKLLYEQRYQKKEKS